MSAMKIAVTIEREMLSELDEMVQSQIFTNRSKAIQEALRDKLASVRHRRLEIECAKLDPAVEKAFAEEGIAMELDAWPEY